MMKALNFLFSLCLLISFNCFGQKFKKSAVIKLVTDVCAEVKSGKSTEVIKKIMDGVHPYKNKDNPAFYVFMYDDKVNIVAHPINRLVGKSYKGKPDVRGKMFRDKIVENAIKKGKGWVSYTYSKPGTTGQIRKRAYYNYCKDGDKSLVVVSGMYAR